MTRPAPTGSSRSSHSTGTFGKACHGQALLRSAEANGVVCVLSPSLTAWQPRWASPAQGSAQHRGRPSHLHLREGCAFGTFCGSLGIEFKTERSALNFNDIQRRERGSFCGSSYPHHPSPSVGLDGTRFPSPGMGPGRRVRQRVRTRMGRGGPRKARPARTLGGARGSLCLKHAVYQGVTHSSRHPGCSPSVGDRSWLSAFVRLADEIIVVIIIIFVSFK